MIRRIFSFFGNMFKAAWRMVSGFVTDIVTNIEGVVILGLATVGCAAVLAEIPFTIATPMWLEATLVIPVLATTIVLLLAWIMSIRMKGIEDHAKAI